MKPTSSHSHATFFIILNLIWILMIAQLAERLIVPIVKIYSHNPPTNEVCDNDESETAYRLPYNEKISGQPFSKGNWEILKSMELFQPNITYVHDAANYLETNKPAVVTAACWKFFPSVLWTIRTMQDHFPDHPLIIYNLGMKKDQMDYIKTICNLSLVHFPFDKFPKHVKRLKEYRWKPILQALSLAKYGAIWYADSSVRFEKNSISVYDLFKPTNFAKAGLKSDYLQFSSAGHGIYAATSPMTYYFLPTDTKRLRSPEAYMAEAGLSLIIRTESAVQDIMKWFVLCALEKDCMRPPDAKIFCHWRSYYPNDYADCHREDQSIINLLQANMYDYKMDRWRSPIRFYSILRHTVNSSHSPILCKRKK